MKTAYTIGGSLVVGICIILISFFVASKNTPVATGTVVGVTNIAGETLEHIDTNDNGVEDWREGLEDLVADTIGSTASTSLVQSGKDYVPPTTLTGKFSEAFLQDFLQAKIDGKDLTDPEAFLANAVTAIDVNTQEKTFSASDIQVIPSSQEKIRSYGNEIANIIAKNSAQEENELVIFKKALADNDPASLAPLTTISTAYKNMLNDTLSLPVPENMLQQHLKLLNAYQSVQTDVEAMTMAFDDPLYALARIRHYEGSALALFDAFSDLARALTSRGIHYDDSDPGAFLNIFTS